MWSTIKKINETKAVFDKINKLDIPLDRRKERRHKSPILEMRKIASPQLSGNNQQFR
jgi:hypothetical protein